MVSWRQVTARVNTLSNLLLHHLPDWSSGKHDSTACKSRAAEILQHDTAEHGVRAVRGDMSEEAGTM